MKSLIYPYPNPLALLEERIKVRGKKGGVMMMGMGYGYLGFLSGLISLTLTIWIVAFTMLVLSKLNKIIELLSKK